MKDLKQLPTIAEKQLGGLKATPAMLGEIKLKAANANQRVGKEAFSVGRPVLALFTALVMCMGVLMLTMQHTHPDAPVVSPSVLDSQPAGKEAATEAQQRALLDVPPGSISLGTGQGMTGGASIFAEGTGGNFPLVSVNGATYRLLTTPATLQGSLQGDLLGAVSEYTLEPALSAGGVVSNVVLQGSEVHAIAGMDGAMVAAPVDGVLCVFQRVSFAGKAVIGGETLRSTLCDPSNVQSIELSGVGTVSDAGLAGALVSTLLSEAIYQNAGASIGGGQTLLIGLRNGLFMQLMVGDDKVSACGTWNCPEFFEAFEEAVGR